MDTEGADMPAMETLDTLLNAHRDTARCLLCECQIDACVCAPLYIELQGDYPITFEELTAYLAEQHPSCPMPRMAEFGLYQWPKSPGELWCANLFWSPLGLDDGGVGIDFNFLWYQPWRVGKEDSEQL